MGVCLNASTSVCVCVCVCVCVAACIPLNSCPVWYFIPQPTCLESMSKHICLNGMFPEQTQKIWPWYEYQWQSMIIGTGCCCCLLRCPAHRHLIKTHSWLDVIFYKVTWCWLLWLPFLSALAVKTTRSTRWCCDIHHDRDPHIHIINTPSLYYQIFLKHLFATANTAELFRVSTTKKTRLPCLLEFSLLIKTIFKCLCAVYFDRTRALHRHFPDIPFVFFSIK